LEGEKDRIPRGCHRTRWNRNGGVLSIKCSNEKWRLVAFISKSLSDTERNYEIHNKEMLAVVRYLEA